MGLATVYRALDALKKEGAVQVRTLTTGESLYSLIQEDRHHLTCLQCGETIELDSCPVHALEKKFRKIAVPLLLAWYFDRYEAILKMRNFAIGAVLVILPVLLIARQPDLGTALLVTAAGFYVLFLAGLSWKILAGLGLLGGASLPFLWSMLHDYQRQRVLTLLDPSQDPLGAGFYLEDYFFKLKNLIV